MTLFMFLLTILIYFVSNRNILVLEQILSLRHSRKFKRKYFGNAV